MLLHVLLLLLHLMLRIFARIVRIAMFASLFHILMSLSHFLLIPWVFVFVECIVQISWLCCLSLAFLLLFFVDPPFSGFSGSALFSVGPRIQIVDVLTQVDWFFEGPADVSAFAPNGFFLADILAFWVLFNMVGLPYRRSEGSFAVDACKFPFLFYRRPFLSGEFLTAFSVGIRA